MNTTDITPYRYVMVDLETLGTNPLTAPVLEIAAIPFNETKSTGIPYTANPSYESNILLGRRPDLDTAIWWLHQERPAPIHGTQTILDAIIGLTAWATKHTDKKTKWFCKGTNFDHPILNDLMDALLITHPWKYYQWNDVRTLQKFFNITPEKSASHSAAQDCLDQISIVQKCFAILHQADATEKTNG
jgi:hypothetical protein